MDAVKGDSVKVVGERTVTAKVVGIGPDPMAADDLIRYHLHISADDAGILFGDDLLEAMEPPFRLTVPVNSKTIKLYKI
jgi:hypothetical protein